MHRCLRCRMACFVAALLAGCADSRAQSPECCGARFDPSTAGCITGQVVWSGDARTATHFPYRVDPGLSEAAALLDLRRNPFVPDINAESHAVRSAVVFLRGVDPRRARPWDHPRVRVEQRDLKLHILQGQLETKIGFVHRGDAVEMVSRDRCHHALHAMGAAWFTLPFPDPDQPLSRRLPQAGVIELTSGAGFYWMRGYLLVADHPYYARTDTEGRFTLARIPPGKYELVCWLPDWRVAEHDRHPDTSRVTRLRFGPPLVASQNVEITAKQTRTMRMEIGVNCPSR